MQDTDHTRTDHNRTGHAGMSRAHMSGVLRSTSARVCAALLVAAFTLSACAYRIDESAVFRPRPVAQDRAPLALMHQDELTEDMGATVAHSLERFAEHDIAVTTVSKGDPARPLILSCGGNASDRPSTGTNYAAKILPFGDVVLWDYPGYGDSSGRATVAAVDAVSRELMDWLDAQAGDRPIVLWGHSLGGFVCAQMAARADFVDAVVLETTARNVEEVARAWRPWWVPVRLKADEALKTYDSAEALSAFTGEVMVLGAGRDSVLPVKLHRSLAESLQEVLPQADYLEMAEATHYSAGFDPRAVEAISGMIARLGSPSLGPQGLGSPKPTAAPTSR